MALVAALALLAACGGTKKPGATPVPTVSTTSAPSPVSSSGVAATGQIAFVSDREGKSGIYLMNTDGTGPARISSGTSDDIFPAWSPDGRRIAFSSDRDGNFEIYMMNADGSAQTRLTNTRHYANPAWSPDWQPHRLQLRS